MTTRRNGMWWRAVLIIAGLLAITGMSAVAGPASATVRNWQIVSGESHSTSDNKGVTRNCPEGTQRLAAGAEVTGDGRHAVVIDNLIPGPQNVTAYAYEYQYGTTEPWVLKVWAVCGNMGTTVHTVSKRSEDDYVEPYKEATVSCPDSTVVIGTGFRLDDARGYALVHTVEPKKHSVTVKAYEVDLFPPGTWSVTAYAICAEDPGDRTVISYTTVSRSTTPQVGAATCPSDKKGFGGGFSLNGFQGRLNINGFIPTQSGIAIFASELVATTNDWSITTDAICMSAELP